MIQILSRTLQMSMSLDSCDVMHFFMFVIKKDTSKSVKYVTNTV